MTKRFFFIIAAALLYFNLPAPSFGQDLLQQADALYNRQDFYGAVAIYQEAVKSSPEDKALRYRLAVCYLKINSAESAIPILKILSKDAADIGRDSSRLLVQYYLSKSLYRDAEALLSDAIARFPDDSGFRASLLSVYENLGSWDRALELLGATVKKGPDFERKRIRYLVKLKRTTEASNIIEQGLASLKDPDFWMELKAFFLRSTGATGPAEKLYLDIFRTTQDSTVLKECAMMYLERQDTASAGRVILSTVKEDNLASWNRAAQLLKDLALYNDLIGLYIRMEAKFPDQAFDRELISLYEYTGRYADLVSRTIAYLRKTGDFDFAGKRLSDLATLEGQRGLVTNVLGQSIREPSTPQDLRAWLLMVLYGIALREDDKTAASVRAAEIVRQETVPDFVFSASDDMALKGWFSEAMALLTDWISRSPDRKTTAACLIRVASLQYQMASYSNSLATLSRVEKGYPGLYDRDSLLSYEGLSLLAAGKYQDAAGAFQEIAKKDGRVQFDLALCKLFLGSTDDALDLCRKARQDKASADDAALLEADIRLSRGETEDSLKLLEDFVSARASSPDAVTALIEMFVVKDVLSAKDAGAGIKDYAAARILMFRRSFSEAADVFLSLSRSFPKYAYYFDYQSAMCYHYIVASPDAAAKALSLFAGCGGNPKAPAYIRSHSLEMSGDILMSQSRSAEAADFYRKALISDPQYSRQKELRTKLANLKK